MKKARVCFVWHMHQPYYTDPVSASASMPWVRLHATKAYFDMAFLLERFPGVNATFNFTPSLLLQLQEIGTGKVRDLFFEHTQRPAEELRPEEKAFLIRHFFSANWATMVRPHPRYHELLVKRGLETDETHLERIARQFSTQELLDLQVWFNLAWFGYGSLHRFPRLAALRDKNRGFTEADKQEVLALQLAAVQQIIPMYRALAERGQVELTTTPFYHPILPLVIDTDSTQRARPDLPLPARFRAPEDAEAQLRLAVEFHTATFGRPPAGLWPSEGSVCPELIPLLPRVGLKWLATDEGNLARSLHGSGQHWHRPADLYRAYRTGPPDGEMTIVFRDRDLSDAFGFIYHKTTPDVAAEDVLRRLRQVVRDVPHENVLIPIILDGENPWEHYHEGGEQFLSALYTAFERQGLHEAGVETETATVSEALALMPPSTHLPSLHSGSWINQDFKIWIGHEEDNRGWNLLSHTRSHLIERTPALSSERATAAWHELYAAEGSDWFWWYGDDFDTAYKEEFDRLFRTHLRNVWTLAGTTPPDMLNQPVCGVRTDSAADRLTYPVSFLHPVLDGQVTDFFEWRGAGTINTRPPLGAMWKADGLLTEIFFGWDLDQLFLRLDSEEAERARREGLQVEVHLQSQAHAFRLTWPMNGAGTEEYLLARRAPEGTWQEIGPSRLFCRKTITELAIPFKELGVETGHALRMSLVILEQGLEIARYPHQHPAEVTVPGPDFESALWRV
ncbi:Glycoside hydrolase, family 57 [Nitrospira japonica]|uniref:Glycoside hydrolase, family 57 n=1 Tax=Nitrospira japonica TaxID=1325564 RepID=A0A1W1I058_9BACT|nr:glycoside hydrolase family 57 protein [Nitrospira japonica]SLM46388.1 Glycoside hydrolase, family 57 [Nitrospira japonica]